ncbi:MAG TPA: hypothetical protein VJR03_15080 [Nitrospira sp.]|nr:hypothetical protein [Nitrospira sp.]
MHVLSTFSAISIDFACAVFILYCFTLLGHSLRSFIPASEWPSPVTVLWEAYLGLTLAAVSVTLLGMTGWFYTPLFVGVLAIGPVLNCRDRSALLAPPRAIWAVFRSLWAEPWAALALAIPALIALISAAVPEIFYDALYYHLGLPQQYLLRGQIQWDPSVVHSAFPAYLDVLFGVCLGIAGPGTAKFFNLLLFFLAWAATAAFVFQVLGDVRPALIGTVTIGTVPGVVVMSTMCAIDAALVGFSAMSALAIARARHAITTSSRGLPGIISLGAVTAGFVAGSKYTGLWLIATLAPALLMTGQWFRTLRAAFAFSTIAIVIAAPWYVRNAWMTGDPLYPAVNAWLGDADALWAVQRLQRDVQTIGLGWTAAADLVNAVLLTPGRLGAGAETGILIPLGAVALLIGALGIQNLRPWALALSLYVPIWMSLTGVMRYLYPAFPLCALGVAWITDRLVGHWPRTRLAVLLVVVIAIAPLWQSVQVLNMVYVGSDVAALLSGSLSRDEYLARRLAYYPAAQWLNAHTDADARILFLGETRLLYVDRQVTFSSAYDSGHFDRFLEPGAPPLWTALRRLGVTHILIHGREIDRLRRSYDYLALTPDAERHLKTSLQECRILFRQSGVQLCALPEGEVD